MHNCTQNYKKDFTLKQKPAMKLMQYTTNQEAFVYLYTGKIYALNNKVTI